MKEGNAVLSQQVWSVAHWSTRSAEAIFSACDISSLFQSSNHHFEGLHPLVPEEVQLL